MIKSGQIDLATQEQTKNQLKMDSCINAMIAWMQKKTVALCAQCIKIN